MWLSGILLASKTRSAMLSSAQALMTKNPSQGRDISRPCSDDRWKAAKRLEQPCLISNDSKAIQGVEGGAGQCRARYIVPLRRIQCHHRVRGGRAGAGN